MSSRRAYFNWYSVRGLGSYLTSESLDNIKLFISRVIVNLLNDPNYLTLYAYTDSWLQNFLQSSYEEQVALVLSTPWNALSAVSRDDEASYNLYVEGLEMKSPREIGYYNLQGGSQLVAQFVWCLCNVIWPNKTFLIVDNEGDSYVIEEGNFNIIYDILLLIKDAPIPNPLTEVIVRDPLLSWSRQPISRLGDSDELSNALATVDITRRGFSKPGDQDSDLSHMMVR